MQVRAKNGVSTAFLRIIHSRSFLLSRSFNAASVLFRFYEIFMKSLVNFHGFVRLLAFERN